MNFNERFKTYTTVELLRVTDNPRDYQPEAVETARALIAERGLTEEEIAAARCELDTERQERLAREREKHRQSEKLKNEGRRFLDAVNPIRKETPGPDKTINLVSIVLGGLYLIGLIRDLQLLKFIFYSLAEWDFGVLLYLVPLIWFPVAIVLFYRRKRAGWFMLAAYMVCGAVMAVMAVALAVMTGGITSSDGGLLPVTLPAMSGTVSLLSSLVLAATVWLICRKAIRSRYSVGKTAMILTIAITALLALGGTYLGV
jgi:hypothetical protein